MRVANEHGISLRQNYNRIAPRMAAQVGRYAHAKQFKRMKKELRALRKARGLWRQKRCAVELRGAGPGNSREATGQRQCDEENQG